MNFEDPSNRSDASLFETPRGVRILPDDSAEPGAQSDPAAPLTSDLRDPGLGDLDLEESERLLEGYDPEAGVYRAGSGKRNADGASHTKVALQTQFRTATRSPGAHFVYALIALTVALGVLGLALTWRDGRVLAACAVITPLSLTWFFIRFRAWLNQAPYWYRLLTSLGENAENLSQFRLLRWFRRAIRALYA